MILKGRATRSCWYRVALDVEDKNELQGCGVVLVVGGMVEVAGGGGPDKGTLSKAIGGHGWVAGVKQRLITGLRPR